MMEKINELLIKIKLIFSSFNDLIYSIVHILRKMCWLFWNFSISKEQTKNFSSRVSSFWDNWNWNCTAQNSDHEKTHKFLIEHFVVFVIFFLFRSFDSRRFMDEYAIVDDKYWKSVNNWLWQQKHVISIKYSYFYKSKKKTCHILQQDLENIFSKYSMMSYLLALLIRLRTTMVKQIDQFFLIKQITKNKMYVMRLFFNFIHKANSQVGKANHIRFEIVEKNW